METDGHMNYNGTFDLYVLIETMKPSLPSHPNSTFDAQRTR